MSTIYKLTFLFFVTFAFLPSIALSDSILSGVAKVLSGPFPVSTPSQKSSDDYINEQIDPSKVRIVFEEDKIKGCKTISKVKTTKHPELWELSEGCSFYYEALKHEAAILKADVVLIVSPVKDCSPEKVEGKAYLCVAQKSNDKK